MDVDAKGNAPLLSVESVSTSYEALEVLQGITFSVAAGEFVGIVGPSGSGKTTLLKTIGGLLRPGSGKVMLRGLDPRLARYRGEVGFVFQNPVLLPWRTVLQNVRLPLELLETTTPRDVTETIELVGLQGFANALPDELSGGMQQRTALARALVFNPSLLLMDEPFGAVDELTREHLNFQLMDLWSQLRTTVVLVTHSVPEVVLMSDRVLVLSNRPARIAGIIQVDLPQPRDRSILASSRYRETVERVRACLAK